jgi:probable phosphoglycerate mutase
VTTKRAQLLYLARHGETDWNAVGRWQGHTDVPLNATGEAQARALAEMLRCAGLSAVVSSDLARARETAVIVARLLDIAVAYVDAGLRERSFGPFEGLTRDDCARLFPEAWRAWQEQRRAPEGAESDVALAARVVAALVRVAECVAGKGPALVVTHGGALRAAVSASLPSPIQNTPIQNTPIQNTAVWKVIVEGGLIAHAEELRRPAPVC